MANTDTASSPLLSISKTREEWVAPCKPTPEGVKLPLSWMDKELYRVIVEVLWVYKPAGGKEGGEEGDVGMLREALAEALVPFYPVAGWIVEEEAAEMAVECTGRGAWFVSASAACTLGDIDYIQSTSFEGDKNLVPSPPTDSHNHPPLLMMQVTRFTCGGAVVGIGFNHGVMDGIGLGMMLKTISTLAGGGNLEPGNNPIWGRDKIPSPIKLPKYEFNLEPRLKPLMLDLPAHKISAVKDHFRALTGRICTTFEVVAALVWRARARAIKCVSPNTMIQLRFPMNARSLLHPIFTTPGSYYGNALYFAGVTQARNTITDAPIPTIISLVQLAKQGFPDDFHSFISGPSDSYEFTLPYDTLITINDWTRTGFQDFSYPCSQLIHYRPLTRSPTMVPTCLILGSPRHGCKARLLVTSCKEEHLDDFLRHMSES